MKREAKHTIFVGSGFTRDILWQIAREKNFFMYDEITKKGCSLERLRAKLNRFEDISYPGQIFLIDASRFTVKHFSLFLKILESTIIFAAIWFYGRKLSSYPLTIRSRCYLGFSTKEEKQLEDFLRANEAFDYFEEMKFLKKYQFPFALTMLKAKDKFLDFMFSLSLATPSRFFGLSEYLEKSSDVERGLFYEWLSYNPLFKTSELQMCPTFRTEKFKSAFERTELEDQFLFCFLVCYKMME